MTNLSTIKNRIAALGLVRVVGLPHKPGLFEIRTCGHKKVSIGVVAGESKAHVRQMVGIKL